MDKGIKVEAPTIMRLVNKLQTLAVINPMYTNVVIYYCLKCLSIFGILWNLVPEVTFFITNLNDIKVCTSVMSTLCQLVTTLFKVLYLSVKIKSHRNLLLIFDQYVRERKLKTSELFYSQAEVKSTKLTTWYLMSIILFFMVYAIPVLVYQIYILMIETTGDDGDGHVYIFPFKHVYLFAVNSNLRYILTISMGLISTALMAIAYLSIDLALFSYCLYVQAFFKDLQTMFRLSAKNNVDDEIKQLKDAIQFHIDILKMTKQVNALFSPIIFMQFLDSSAIICTVIFQSTLTFSMRSETIKNYVFVFGAICQILFYSFFGTIISTESYNIGMAAYSWNWIEPLCHNKVLIRKYILFIIHRSHIETGLDGLKLFKCNLQTFISIMNASLSALAVLQSITG